MARDFSKKDFTRIIRGYSPEEVDSYIESIGEEYGKLENAVNGYSRKLALALKKLDDMNNYAEMLEKRLEEGKGGTAELSRAEAEENLRKSREILDSASGEAGRILKEAEEKARSERNRILEDAEEKAREILDSASREVRASSELRKSAAGIYDEVCAFRDELFTAYNAHIESIESLAGKAEESAEILRGGPQEAGEAEEAPEEDLEGPAPEGTVTEMPEPEMPEEEKEEEDDFFDDFDVNPAAYAEPEQEEIFSEGPEEEIPVTEEPEADEGYEEPVPEPYGEDEEAGGETDEWKFLDTLTDEEAEGGEEELRAFDGYDDAAAEEEEHGEKEGEDDEFSDFLDLFEEDVPSGKEEAPDGEQESLPDDEPGYTIPSWLKEEIPADDPGDLYGQDAEKEQAPEEPVPEERAEEFAEESFGQPAEDAFAELQEEPLSEAVEEAAEDAIEEKAEEELWERLEDEAEEEKDVIGEEAAEELIDDQVEEELEEELEEEPSDLPADTGDAVEDYDSLLDSLDGFVMPDAEEENAPEADDDEAKDEAADDFSGLFTELDREMETPGPASDSDDEIEMLSKGLDDLLAGSRRPAAEKEDPGKEEGAAGSDDEFYFSGDDDADLDRLKKFFASDLGTEQDDGHRSDAGSSSTTNIALNLNSFMDGDSGDFYTGNGDDVDFADDNVAEEFDIIFGKMDSKKNVEEILQQPTIPPEEPSNPHRHGRN